MDPNSPTNLAIQAASEKAYNRHQGPRVGDFIRMLDGTLRRITSTPRYKGAGIQTTSPGFSSSFYLGASLTPLFPEDEGYASYSGALDSPIPTENVVLTDEVLPGKFWHFDNGFARAHAGIDFSIPCRVYKQVA